MSYQTITMNTPHLICYRSEHGQGIYRSYIIVLNDSTMQEIHLLEQADCTQDVQVRYESISDDIRDHLNLPIMREVGYKPCSKAAYLKAQNAFHLRKLHLVQEELKDVLHKRHEHHQQNKEK